MAEVDTVARPYASAVFEMAQAGDAMAAWSDALAAIAAIVENEDAAALIDNPAIGSSQKAALVIDVGGDDIGSRAANLVRVLADGGRLRLAPAIAEQFEARRAAFENTLDVEVVTAAGLDDSQRQAIAKALEKRLRRTIRLSVHEDERMLGGAIIKADDWVIDGSVAAQLTHLRESMVH